MYVNLFEEPEKVKVRHVSASIDFIYKTEEAKKRAGEESYKSAKKMYPVFIIIGTALYIGGCISNLIEKASEGLIILTKFTFIIGIMLFINYDYIDINRSK